jgi:hypothetical protein
LSDLIRHREAVMLLRPTMLVRLAMRHTARGVAVVVVAWSVLGAPAMSVAAASPGFTPGARTLGDSLFPTIGNGGYDVRHYDLDLNYAIVSKRLGGLRPSTPSPLRASPVSPST